MHIKKDRDILDIAQLVVTMVTALFAVHLNNQQGELSRRIQREGITQTYADKVLGYVVKLEMPPKERDAIVIDMLDIITEANINTGEQPYSDAERQQLIPLRLALAKRDADLIAHIGTKPGKLKLWTSVAMQSGNDAVKQTAIEALAQIGRYRARESELETFRLCIEKMLDISDDFARVKISEGAIQEFTHMAEVVGKVPSLLDDPPLKALMQRGRSALIVVAGRAIEQEAVEQLEPSAPTPTPAKPSPTALQNTSPDGSEDGMHRVVNRESGTGFIPQVAGGQKVFRLASSMRSIQKALKQVDSLNLKTAVRDKPLSPPPTNLSATIADLKSSDIEKRRSARQLLANGGAANVPLLLAALRAEPDDERIKVGITYGLSKISEPATISKAEDARLLVKLTGDKDAEVRQYASEFLMQLSHSASIKLCQLELQSVIERERPAAEPNGEAVYQAVLILGTWMRTLPPELSAEKTAITKYLRELQPKLTPSNNWVRALALVTELNTTGPESTPVQN